MGKGIKYLPSPCGATFLFGSKATKEDGKIIPSVTCGATFLFGSKATKEDGKIIPSVTCGVFFPLW